MKSLFAEMRRRGVLHGAAIYAAVAWAVTEVAATIFPALFLPSWIVTAVVIVMISGFPVVMFLAWAFDFRAGGLYRVQPGSLRGAMTIAVGIGLLAGAASLLFLLARQGALQQQNVEPAAAETFTPLPHSVAVLPFADFSPDRDRGYLGDGFAESLLHQLAQYENLRVIARTSSFAFRGQDEGARSIGRKLNVGAVLEGSVQEAGDRLRVIVQLIDTRDGTHMWSQSYDRASTDLFAIQDDISLEVARSMAVTLMEGRSSILAGSTTDNIDAYELYLLGRFFWHKRNAADLRRAVGYFELAISKDHDYSLAHSGLADAYMLLSADEYGDIARQDALEQAEGAALQALALNDELSEAHASLGLISHKRGDHEAAETLLRRAIELNPNYAAAYLWYGKALHGQTRYNEALAAHRTATKLDPLSAIAHVNVGVDLFWMGRSAEAEATYRRALDIDPEFPNAYWGLAATWEFNGRLTEAIATYKEALARDPGNLLYVREIGLIHLIAGNDAEADEWIRRAEAVAQGSRWVEFVKPIFAKTRGERDVLLARALARYDAEPDDPGTLARLAMAEVWAGDYAQALTHYLSSGSLGPPHDYPLYNAWDIAYGQLHSVGLAYAASRAGDQSTMERALVQSREYLDGLQGRGMGMAGASYVRAQLHAVAGEEEQSLVALRTAIEKGWRNLRFAAHDPMLSSLHSHAQFEALFRVTRHDDSRR